MTTIEIRRDEDTESPRKWDNLGTMIAFHTRYNLGDKDHGFKSSDYNGWDEMEAAILKANPGGVILPLYLYDHSGITMNTTGFHCPWDSGRVGFIVASADKIRESFGVKRITARIRHMVQESLKSEVGVYDQYLTGDVYYFQVLDDAGEVEQSCGGFYGSDPFENGMSEHIDSDLHGILAAAKP